MEERRARLENEMMFLKTWGMIIHLVFDELKSERNTNEWPVSKLRKAQNMNEEMHCVII